MRIGYSALLVPVLALIPLLPFAQAEDREQGVNKTGLTVYVREQAFAGFTLYPVERTSSILLLNMAGEVVHHWPLRTVRARLLPDCSLLIISNQGGIEQYDWNGKMVWSAKAPHQMHHDFDRIENGNTFVLYRKRVLYRPLNPEAAFPDAERRVRSDAILELSPGGLPIWEWHFDHHLDHRSCGPRPCNHSPDAPDFIKKIRDWSHANTVRRIPENRFFDAGDHRFRPGNLITLARNLWTVYIIDYQSKEVVWTYSGNYKGGLRFPHEAHMIDPGLPGAGNILIFDNGRLNRGSFALEVDPIQQRVVWAYLDGKDFYSKGLGSLMRLPNGNTFISEDTRGRVFEVTPGKEIVWEYRGSSSIRRAPRYAPAFCPRLQKLPVD